MSAIKSVLSNRQKSAFEDMCRACQVISEAVASQDIDRYNDDLMFRFGIERAILIISEAARHFDFASVELGSNQLSELLPNHEWKEIKGIGSVIRHKYFRLDAEVIWRVATVHNPRLHTDLMTLSTRLL